MDAVANGRIERVRLLLAAGADTGAWDALGNTPLHVAAARGDSQIVSALLGAGAIRANQPSRGTGRTPLHEAAFYRHLDVIRLLLDGGADVNARDRGRQTPLHVAAACGSADVVALLLRLGADSTAHDDKGHTPADLAAAKATESARPDEGFRAVLALLNQP